MDWINAFQIEKHLEDAFKTQIAEALPNCTVFRGSDTDELVTPRVIIIAGRCSADETANQTENGLEYLKFECSIEIALITDTSQGETRDAHHEKLGTIRDAFRMQNPTNFRTLLPNHEILDIRMTSTAREQQGDHHITMIDYLAKVAVMLT